MITRFIDVKGYGFVGVPGHQKDVFIHQHQVLNKEDTLDIGAKVKFVVRKDPKDKDGRPQAFDVEVLYGDDEDEEEESEEAPA